jgi:hypothetical protein
MHEPDPLGTDVLATLTPPARQRPRNGHAPNHTGDLTMLNETDTQTITTATTLAPYSESRARQYLMDHPAERSARKLGDLWGWHRSKAERFINRFEAETRPETVNVSTETPPTPHKRTANPEAKFSRESSEPVVSGADADADGETIAFTWDDGEDVLFQERRATAAYFNKLGELVIRQQVWPDDDAIIYVPGNDIATFIDKLTEICDIGGSKP